MSRTYAHRPAWVWMNDHPDLVRESHNHAHGPCDLPVAPFTDAAYSARDGRCYAYLSYEIRLCSCALCSYRPWRRRAERARRAAERTLARAAARGADEATLELLEGRVPFRAF